MFTPEVGGPEQMVGGCHYYCIAIIIHNLTQGLFWTDKKPKPSTGPILIQKMFSFSLPFHQHLILGPCKANIFTLPSLGAFYPPSVPKLSSFLHLLCSCLLNTYCVPGTVPSASRSVWRHSYTHQVFLAQETLCLHLP